MTDNPRFKEITNMSLNSTTLVDFITRQRRRLGWETTVKDENEVIFMLAFVGSFISILPFGAFHILPLLPIWIVLIWIAATVTYIAVRREGKGENCKDMDHAIDVIKKSIKRGKVGIERKHSDLFFLVGTYHNDLIGEDVSDSLSLTEKDIIELYDSLEGLGNFRDQTQVELPVSTVQIPFNV